MKSILCKFSQSGDIFCVHRDVGNVIFFYSVNIGAFFPEEYLKSYNDSMSGVRGRKLPGRYDSRKCVSSYCKIARSF